MLGYGCWKQTGGREGLGVVKSSTPPLTHTPTHTHSLSPPDTSKITSKLRLSEPRSHLRVYFGSPFLVLLERWNISLKRGVGENNQRAS